MYRINVLLSAVWVLALSGCMTMGGMEHMQGTGMMHQADPTHDARFHLPVHYTEANHGGLTLALSFPAPSRGVVVPIDARLSLADGRAAFTDASIRLHILTPDGSVDEFGMEQVDSSAAGTYRAQYGFRSAGTYVVTAHGRMGKGADVRTVSVSIKADCDREPLSGPHHRPGTAVLVAGGSVAVIMALMMSGSAH